MIERIVKQILIDQVGIEIGSEFWPKNSTFSIDRESGSIDRKLEKLEF